jgi:hypothetical protein
VVSIFNMLLTAFTIFHVLLSLIGIVAGIIVLYGWIKDKSFEQLTTIFLITTVATSVTGFFFPFHGVTPGIILGVISLIVLAAAYATRRKSDWRRTFVITSTLALFFNFFVLIAQSFQKVPFLKSLAPTGTEPPFKIAVVLALVLFAVGGVLAVRKQGSKSKFMTAAG